MKLNWNFQNGDEIPSVGEVWIFFGITHCLFFRPPSGSDPGQVHMKYDAVKLQDYEFKITK